MNEFEKNGFATFVNNGDGWERIPNAKFMMKDENGTKIEMTPDEVIKQLMQDNKSLEHYINNLQSKIYKSDELIETYKNERDTYKRLTEAYIKEYKDLIRKIALYETILGDKNETIGFYKARIKKAIKELNNRDYDDGDFESMKFQNHVINILEGDEE